ncbi:MAG: thermonuclease family protein [Acidobacteriia bacterium]|nr:thermonuclease family protein [Terriglobia bacterium]
MRTKWFPTMFLGLMVLVLGVSPALAGDSLYGKVTEVKSAQVVVFDYGRGHYDIRIVGIDVPQEGTVAREARQFVSNLVLGKKVRMRFEQRTANGEMVSRLFTDDPAIGIKDVGLELLKAGLARKQPKYDYKYGELSAAEAEAQKAGRGLWAATRQK